MVFQKNSYFHIVAGQRKHNCFLPHHLISAFFFDIPSYEKYLTMPLGEDMGYARGVGWGDFLSGYQDICTMTFSNSLDPETDLKNHNCLFFKVYFVAKLLDFAC